MLLAMPGWGYAVLIILLIALVAAWVVVRKKQG